MMLHAVVPQRLKIIPDFRALLFPERKDIHSVSYTHLTLPTILLV